MEHFEEIYASQAEAYHAMISAEDADGNLLPALNQIVPLRGKRVLDLGSGTGRIPLMIYNIAGQMAALDLNLPMLREQQKQRQKVSGEWWISQGDMRTLPFADDWAQIVIAGWGIGHLCSWFAQDWKTQIGLILKEMERVISLGGTIIILETMSTGSHVPAPPTDGLANYYAWLESEHGFSRRVIQTDYRFNTVEEAVARTEFFFGSELANSIRKNAWTRLPEWTGIWSKRRVS